MRRNPESLHFDLYVFDPRYRAAWRSQRVLSYSDSKRMGIERHPQVQARRGGYPAWLFSDKKVRAVVSEKLIGRPAKSVADLRTAAHERYQLFMQENFWKPAGRAHYLAVQKNANILMLYMKMIWLYRRGFDAKEIAHEVGMSHGAVRQRLLRLNRIAAKLFPQA